MEKISSLLLSLCEPVEHMRKRSARVGQSLISISQLQTTPVCATKQEFKFQSSAAYHQRLMVGRRKLQLEVWSL